MWLRHPEAAILCIKVVLCDTLLSRLPLDVANTCWTQFWTIILLKSRFPLDGGRTNSPNRVLLVETRLQMRIKLHRFPPTGQGMPFNFYTKNSCFEPNKYNFIFHLRPVYITNLVIGSGKGCIYMMARGYKPTFPLKLVHSSLIEATYKESFPKLRCSLHHFPSLYQLHWSSLTCLAMNEPCHPILLWVLIKGSLNYVMQN